MVISPGGYGPGLRVAIQRRPRLGLLTREAPT
jgi:hypothetical protein